MKSRYIVTLIVLVLGIAAITGIYLRLQENAATDDEPDTETSAVVDSALEAVPPRPRHLPPVSLYRSRVERFGGVLL